MLNRISRFFTDDNIVFFVIFLNAILLFTLAFELDIDTVHKLEWLDAIFILYFLLEALFKIRGSGWKGYIKMGWNRFDFIILLCSIPTIYALIWGNMQESEFSLIFLFRIVRVVRFFKFLKFIPNMEELLAGIRRAFKASVFVVIAFVVFGFVISMISTKLFGKVAPDLFGDPVVSFYNIFKVFTIEGWFDVPEAIIEAAGWAGQEAFLTKAYFIVIVVTGGLFGLSIVNAIFVEEMVRDNNDDIILKMEEMDKKLESLLSQKNEASGNKS
ncbi:MAG: ion transporter [Bacteroidota bacterium]